MTNTTMSHALHAKVQNFKYTWVYDINYVIKLSVLQLL